MSDSSTRLARKIHTKDAVIIGLASMIGSGIFAAIGPAVLAAGSGVVFGVLIAAVLAYLNATSVAQLAVIYPESGGAYIYGKNQLGPLWGFLAGWGFVIGKIASCTAMALTFGYYVFPPYAKFFGASAVVLLTTINYFGIKKTALATRLIISVVLFSLGGVVFAALFGGDLQVLRLLQWEKQESVWGILESAGLMFFAFAGYARIATLGEEVSDPKNTIPKAILIALGITVIIYLVVIVSSLLAVDVSALAHAPAPLQAVVDAAPFSYLSPIVKLGACFGSLGVLLSLLAGVSRTTFAMANKNDLPSFLSKVHSTHKVPHVAEALVGLLVAFTVLFVDLRTAIGFSSFAILSYYAIANLSAWTLRNENRLWPHWMSMLGFVSCITIAFNLPASSIVGGLALFLVGFCYYKILKR